MSFPPTHPALARALEAQGYEEPTPVQSAVLEAPSGMDLLVSAQTGSGKTVAFGLAAAETLLGESEKFGPAGAPLALAIAPTRELALQVARELGWLYAHTGARVATCVGGMDPRAERRALEAGAHIVVGTPGRLRDHLERGALDLSALKVAVLDEADEMLDLGFREDLEEILDASPPERLTLLFSATIAKGIPNLARRYQRDAIRIDTTDRNVAHVDIEYRAVRVGPSEVENAVVNLLRYFEAPGALIFCSTREAVRRLYGALRERGFAAVALSGEMTQKERSDALQSLRDGHARACVATDVAARGLDLPDLGLVIHADLPVNKAALLHRSGRTGRAGRKGVSILIVPHTRRRRAESLLAASNIDAAWQAPPQPDDIHARDQARLLDDPILSEAPSDEDLALAARVLEGRSPEVVATALIRLHRSRLPAPEEMLGGAFDPAKERKPQRERGDRPERDGPRREDSFSGQGMEGASWFRLDIGRSKNADPKWLIPLICRIGHVTKKDIGSIRIFDRETKFEISREAEPRFSEAIRQASDKDTVIEPAGAPGPRRPRSFDGPTRNDRGKPQGKWATKVAQPKSGPKPRRTAYDPLSMDASAEAPGKKPKAGGGKAPKRKGKGKPGR